MFSMLKMSLCAAAAAAIFMFASGVRADVTIQGAGATFPQPLYTKWIEEFKKVRSDVIVDYQGVGSGGGINAITGKTVQFGASDAPLTAAQEKTANNELIHLPTVAGPTAIIFNIQGVNKLTLDGEVIAGIYMNTIKTWNDAKITKLNPGVTLPASPIVVAHRSDGSGTTYIFTDYLSKVSKDWAEKVGKGTTVEWPKGVGGPKSDGVAATVKGTSGGIGYVEQSYATKNNLAYAEIVNKAGKPVAASIAGVNAASGGIGKFPDDMKVSITDAAGDASYPISGFTYLVVYKDFGYMKDKNKAQATVDFIRWCMTDGQKLAEANGYAKLPADAQTMVLEKLKAIKFNGEALK